MDNANPMGQHRSSQNQNTRYYRNELLLWRLSNKPTTPKEMAAMAEVDVTTVSDALSGHCKKLSTLWAIASVLDLKWEYLFKLDLPENQFRRAVANHGSLKAGPVRVGADRLRRGE